MTDEQAGTSLATTTQRAAARPERQFHTVENAVPIFDTARFEHYQRIANVMCLAPLVPESLRGANKEEAFGNCFLVVTLADRLGMDPFMLAQCCSVVYGRLMIEGKAVDAALRGKAGIKLNVYFTGDRGKEDRRIYASEHPLTEDQVKALKPGVYPFGFEDMIDGSIGEWKTKEKSGVVMAAWTGQQSEMQLRYRATRTWARANRPDIMMGIYTEDEMVNLEAQAVASPRTAGRVKQDLRGKLAAPDAPQEGKGGFDKTAAGSELETVKTNEDGKVIETATNVGGRDEGKIASGEQAEPGKAGQAVAAKVAETTRATPSQSSEDDDGTKGLSKEAIAKAMAEATGQPEQVVDRAEWEFKDTVDGPAPREVTYLMFGDDEGDDGKLPTYQNGELFSRVGRKGAKSLIVYEEHPGPVVVDSEAQEPEPEDEDTDLPGAFGILDKSMGEATKWSDAKAAVQELYKSSDWANLTEVEQNAARAKVWRLYEARMEDGAERIDFASNPTAFSLWMHTQTSVGGADAIIGNLRVLQKESTFLGMKPEQQTRFSASVEAHAKNLRQAG